jgi:hypothetical protein
MGSKKGQDIHIFSNFLNHNFLLETAFKKCGANLSDVAKERVKQIFGC